MGGLFLAAGITAVAYSVVKCKRVLAGLQLPSPHLWSSSEILAENEEKSTTPTVDINEYFQFNRTQACLIGGILTIESRLRDPSTDYPKHFVCFS